MLDPCGGDSDPCPVEDNIVILSTPYFPDHREAQEISSRIQVRRQRIESLERTIQELCAQRDALQLTNAVGQGLLAPIRKLPSEILAEIFTQCMPTVHMPLDGNDHVYELPVDRIYGNYDIARSRHPTFVRMRLTQICRRWRDIISDTPSMWTTLVLNHSFREDFASIVEMSLRNSKNCLLDVFIVPRAWRVPSEAIQDTMSLLNGQIHRFRSFFADLKYTSGHEVYLPLLFVSDPELSSMVSFGVWTGRGSDQETIGEPNFPKLKSLDLWGPFSTPLLRSLTVNPLPLLNRLRFKVTRASQSETRVTFPTSYDHVESLHLDYHAWVHFGKSQYSQPLTTVSLPLLKNLVIISLEPINARSLLPPLHIPSLEKLRLGVPQGFDEADDITFGRASISWVFKQHYLVDIFDSLLHLTIDNASLTGNDIRQWLPRFVNLGSLKIVARAGARSFISEAFFSALHPTTSQASPASRPCPKLERLILRRVSFLGRSADHLVSFVRERSRNLDIVGQPCPDARHLQYLEVMRCQGISSRHLGELRRSEVSGAIVKYRPVSSSSCERAYPLRVGSDSEESGNYD